MFAAPIRMDHDEWVTAVRNGVSSTSLGDVTYGFLVSLSSRRLDLRSALGSYAVARHIGVHDFGMETGGHTCSVCDLMRRTESDLNILSFERHKWGGVRGTDVTYLVFDLAQFARASRLAPTDEDIKIGRELLTALAMAPSTATISTFAGTLTMLKGNLAERRSLLQILAMCGVLRTPHYPGYRESFVPAVARELPNRRFVDDPYPACWWTGGDGLDWAAVNEFLPSLSL